MPYTETDSGIERNNISLSESVIARDRRIVEETGIQIERVYVSDGSEHEPGRIETQLAIASMDQLLTEHPTWEAPYFDEVSQEMVFDPNNKSSEALYNNSVTLQRWVTGAAQAQAVALYPLQRQYADRLPSGEVIDDKSRAFFHHGLDAIGIRTRARIMAEISGRYLNDKPAARWVSLACGGAVPVIEALTQSDEIGMVHLDFVDFDPDALSFASELATHEGGLQKVPAYNHEDELRSYTTHQINLIRGLIASDSLVGQFGERSSDMVDALGIFEYFSKKDSVTFLRNAYRLVRDDGVMVIANMLSDRPQIEFNKRAVGWPKLYPRSIEELSQIVTDAGIHPHNARIYIPEDGIYAVIEIKK